MNDSQEFGAVVEAMECISRLTTRYRIMEDLYLCTRDDDDGTVKEFEASLLDLYALILSFSSKARRYYIKNPFARAPTSTFRGAAAWSNDFQTKVSTQDIVLDRYARILDARRSSSASNHQNEQQLRLLTLMECIIKPVQRMDLRVGAIEDGIEEERSCRILQWMSKIPYRVHHRSASKN